jgi:protein-L-isoaspartate(D-aspartate) O-methyltransferase
MRYLPGLSRARDRMVNIQIAGRGVRDPLVLEAMRRVPREAFVEPGFEEFAYEDGPLPIGEGQTISQPYIVALMIEAAEVKPGDRVLEVGAGSGYAVAVIGQIADRVYAIERHPIAGQSRATAVQEAWLRQYRPAHGRWHAWLARGRPL